VKPTRSAAFQAMVPSGDRVYRDSLTVLIGQLASQACRRGAAPMYVATPSVEDNRSPPRLNERPWRRTFGLEPSPSTIPVRRFTERVAEWTQRYADRGLQ
jgi:hypothetical protein